MAYTGSSYDDINTNYPETHDKSGYYRINSYWTYINMTVVAPDFISTCVGIGGGWRRIININTSAGGDCPSGWLRDIYSGISFCCLVSDNTFTCSGANFSINGTSYQRVFGRARGYQKGVLHTVYGYHIHGNNIDHVYADGLLITYGHPRNHIWSYVNGHYDNRAYSFYNCPCTK